MSRLFLWKIPPFWDCGLRDTCALSTRVSAAFFGEALPIFWIDWSVVETHMPERILHLKCYANSKTNCNMKISWTALLFSRRAPGRGWSIENVSGLHLAQHLDFAAPPLITIMHYAAHPIEVIESSTFSDAGPETLRKSSPRVFTSFYIFSLCCPCRAKDILES